MKTICFLPGMTIFIFATVSGLLVAEPATSVPNSADRLLFWTSAANVVGLNDAELDLWESRGVGGFICMSRHLAGMGSKSCFTGDPEADLNQPGFELQRSIRNSKLIARAKQRGMRMYLGCHLVNYYNKATPLKDWFDDAGWAGDVIPRIREFAAAARLLGFDGIAFDEELYPQSGKVTTATWEWDYPGNTHSETEVRAKVRQRGCELMHAVLEGCPAVELVVYHYRFPETWNDVVQKRVNHIDHPAEKLLFLDFWDGLSSIEGYQAIRFINSLFYKGPTPGTWETALQYEYNGFYSLLSRRLSNWPYASSRIYQSPFSWISAGPKARRSGSQSTYDAARSPEHVARQLEAFRRWGMGREFANFCYGGLQGFDYGPYTSAMQSAAQPAVIDSQPPKLEINAPTRGPSFETSDPKLDLKGTARDNLAIRMVRWENDRGGKGAAQMTWNIIGGNEKSGYDWQMDWSIEGIALHCGTNRIKLTAEDIKGLSSSTTVCVEKK